jgi:hypothetical protein
MCVCVGGRISVKSKKKIWNGNWRKMKTKSRKKLGQGRNWSWHDAMSHTAMWDVQGRGDGITESVNCGAVVRYQEIVATYWQEKYSEQEQGGPVMPSFIFFASYDSQGYGRSIRPRLQTTLTSSSKIKIKVMLRPTDSLGIQHPSGA